MLRDAAVLKVPADAAYARAVRMFAANLAVVGEFGVDEVEDLRMATEEGFVYACSTGLDEVEVRFALQDGGMAIDFDLGEGEPDEDDPALEYAALLLSALCDRFEIDGSAHVLHLAKAGRAS